MTHKQMILNILMDGDWHHIGELTRVTHRFGEHLHKMRRLGIDYEYRNGKDIKKPASGFTLDPDNNYYRLLTDRRFIDPQLCRLREGVKLQQGSLI